MPHGARPHCRFRPIGLCQRSLSTRRCVSHVRAAARCAPPRASGRFPTAVAAARHWARPARQQCYRRSPTARSPHARPCRCGPPPPGVATRRCRTRCNRPWGAVPAPICRRAGHAWRVRQRGGRHRCRVGRTPRDAVAVQQRLRLGGEPAGMARLAHHCAVPAPAQDGKEAGRHACIEYRAGRQLQQQAAQALAQRARLRQNASSNGPAWCSRASWLMPRGSLTEKRKCVGTLSAQRA